MYKKLNHDENKKKTRKRIGYVPLKEGTPKLYKGLGFKCGLEVHQQLKTEKKLFCRCPAGKYQEGEDYDAEIVRHMRPTLSELGEYDGTALMEFKTKKNITYRIKNETACTYEVDDTPPFPLNEEALDISIKIAQLLKTSIVGELHITRKQYLDGSIPTGFQRTAIVGIEGKIPLKGKDIGIIQLSIEEDSCREVSDIKHNRIYTTDRLGMPLIEAVTYPHMITPSEAEEAAHYIRFLTRSTGNVRTGIGAAREDVNVSITGGTRVEIKGVSHIKWIPALTHNEAFRQKALLEIKNILKERIKNIEEWDIANIVLNSKELKNVKNSLQDKIESGYRFMGVKLPGFREILSFFTQPGKVFASELSERLKVIACLESPNIAHSEEDSPLIDKEYFDILGEKLDCGDNDALAIIWGPQEDIETALETIRERCLLAFRGVPNETRKSVNKDGITIFERVLPGPDRMYPDTDSAPIAIKDEKINRIGKNLPSEISFREKKMRSWNIPEDTFTYIHIRNLFPLLERSIKDLNYPPTFIGTLLGHQLKNLEGKITPSSEFDFNKIYGLLEFCEKEGYEKLLVKQMLPVLYQYPNMDPESILTTIDFKKKEKEEIISLFPLLNKKFAEISQRQNKNGKKLWIMGRLQPIATGNISLKDLSEIVEGGLK
ncbi:MAG: Glu-tRNA(Gln) amidotransferase subunit GatE [Acidobacteriota bacterium]